MKKRSVSGLLLAVLLVCVLTIGARATEPLAQWEATILFTHDLHSHFLPQRDGSGNESGGYARLKTAIDREREEHPDALLVDGGDFSIGSLIQTLYTTQGAELRTMGAMGYDVTALGNHEFDHRMGGMEQMLTAAARSGDPLPALVCANYRPAGQGEEEQAVEQAMADYGLEEYVLLERGGVTFGIFGIFGKDAHQCAPTSGFALEDPVQAAKRCVEELKAQGAHVIICLSHSGTSTTQESEDEELAKAVPGIDLIVSGHTHTTLEQPIQVGDTLIVSAGEYSENLGSITLRGTYGQGEKEILDYELIPVDQNVAEDPEIARMTENWKEQVSDAYLSQYDLTYDQVLTYAEFDLLTPESGVQQGNNLGELAADSFLWALDNLAADQPDVPTIAVTADGVLRAPLWRGEITTSQAFDVLSMGVGEDGNSGFPLVAVYLTGEELMAVAEVDASVTPLMPSAQLYMAGLDYTFNPHRMIFNRVSDIQFYEKTSWQKPEGDFNLVSWDARYEDLEKDRLYRVVAGMYAAQMLGTVRDQSFGLLSLEPKMADGTPVTDYTQCILYDDQGNEVKEWYALAAYLDSFGPGGLPYSYQSPQGDGRKEVSRSWNPVELLTNLNRISLTVFALVLVLAAAGVVTGRWIGRRKKRSHKNP